MPRIRKNSASSVRKFRLQIVPTGEKIPLPLDQPITQPDQVAEAFRDLSFSDRESFISLALDARNVPIGYEEVSIGALSATIVHPREVFKALILSNAAAVIFVHNHPSGSLLPSNDDLNLTNRLKELADLLGIKILDHLIVGPMGGFYSMQQAGNL